LFKSPPLNASDFVGDATRQSWPSGFSILTYASRSKATFSVDRMKSNAASWWVVWLVSELSANAPPNRSINSRLSGE
jgi:hypothetical protein